MENVACDPITGFCTPAALAPEGPAEPAPAPDLELLYVGDPMCSACWGLAPGLKELQAYAAGRDLPFTVVVGGLRPGGGDAWTPAFRRFLRHEWETVGARTGQPFSTAFLERDAFDYDTEPACRAVVVAREMLGEGGDVYAFFASIQRRFYVEGEDPTRPAFYDAVCREHGLDADAFRARFDTPEARAATRAEFERVRSWGVRGFPTVLLRRGDQRTAVAVGYADADAMTEAVESLAPSAISVL